ncbi:type 1 glutamine amidotransferase [Asanoa sp. WMMD1127]|uniref:type 1 glutamine amidotransferase domain-containing protein n=1 Tax=Asanoa sp. WMMD1127 TaxID=3016107 RepID=UPI0024178ECA|nr:type 1 glutamine amidotransferase domain-containing protein [Asanoa sp. WMMD1127]MDG4821545.1 type 1 glutamine amidotransferase [Asanoa sp. WMMD1127]
MQLDGKRIAFLATDGVEEAEYAEPRDAVEKAGATAELISIKSGSIQSMDHDEKSKTYPVDREVSGANAADYDALVLPGGVQNPDKLRMDQGAVAFVKAFAEAGKPIAVICHGPWTLVEAGVVKGRTITSYPSVRTDLVNAGANWVDQEVVVDGNLISSRNPSDIPAFNKTIVEKFASA